ncbi:MAG: 23S rRNA (adenine(2503)-C(2))-methyltransferase RlmN [Candidatus Carbobacillus altaicus]|nr:23S rRNA (adenine(2503)-C(2))-methyltransferase RlmN [Candidatus Carbobacillus altaicus]
MQLIYDLTYDKLEAWLLEHGHKTYRAKQIFEWIYQKRIHTFEEMTNIPQNLRDLLKSSFTFGSLHEITRTISQDGTIKFLLSLEDNSAIETVIMKHSYGYSVCVTTQVGCKIGCTFCASTLGGLKRNLSTGEIVAQMIFAQRILDKEDKRASHIVVMGIGEPFENFEAVIDFLRIVNDQRGLAIGGRHITVSTSGIIPRIYDFADLNMQIKLAISLHAPNSELRSRIMPINKKYPLPELLNAVQYYVNRTRRRVTFEYALLGGVNDSEEQARELARLVKPIFSYVNLIPVNYVPERRYVQTPPEQIENFKRVLREEGIVVTQRREHGSDIAAACGQLRAKHERTLINSVRLISEKAPG